MLAGMVYDRIITFTARSHIGTYSDPYTNPRTLNHKPASSARGYTLKLWGHNLLLFLSFWGYRHPKP